MKTTLLAALLFVALNATGALADVCRGTTNEIIDCLNNKLAYVELKTDAGGRPIVVVTGANVQIRRASSGDKTGNLVVGSNHFWSEAEEGFVAGDLNTISGLHSTVSGGSSNTASGRCASVSGGNSNTASSNHTSVSGGRYNEASFQFSSVSGGEDNTASGYYSSVSGGNWNHAYGYSSTVSGGSNRSVSGSFNWRAGNYFQTQ